MGVTFPDRQNFRNASNGPTDSLKENLYGNAGRLEVVVGIYKPYEAILPYRDSGLGDFGA